MMQQSGMWWQLFTTFRPRYILCALQVHPHWQGRGIAKQLLTRVIAHTQQTTIQRISLNTQADNHVAQHLYKQFGFLLTGDQYDVYSTLPVATTPHDTA
jgi:ribosomal protein S18 acetylase RimI-like enzyme